MTTELTEDQIGKIHHRSLDMIACYLNGQHSKVSELLGSIETEEEAAASMVSLIEVAAYLMKGQDMSQDSIQEQIGCYL